MAIVLKIMCWWEMTPCILVYRYQSFGGSCHLIREASSTLLLEAVFSVKTFVVIIKLNVTSCLIRLQSSCLQICHCSAQCCGDPAEGNIDMLHANYD